MNRVMKVRYVLAGSALFLGMMSAAACGRSVIIEGGGGNPASGGSDGGVDGPTCDAPEIACNGVCINPARDAIHCGACNRPCAFGEFCRQGSCEDDCGELTPCGASCIDTTSDRSNCGGCGFLCAFDETCVDSQCIGEDVCPPNLTDCGMGLCVDTLSDPNHCGGCFDPCPSGQCINGLCFDDMCLPPLVNCGGQCVDLAFDQFHCGDCFNQCEDNELCQAGECDCGQPKLCGFCEQQLLPPVTPHVENGSLGGANEHDPGCASGGSPEDVFIFTAPSAGTYVFDTSGSSFDTVLFTFDLALCVESNCDDDPGAGVASRLSVTLAANETILVGVDGFGGQQGNYTLSVQGP